MKMKKILFLIGFLSLSGLIIQAAPPTTQGEIEVNQKRIAGVVSSSMRLETARLILRKVEERDLDDIYEYAKDPKVAELTGWTEHENLDDTRNFLDKMREGYNTGMYLYLVIEDKELHKVVGTCAIVHISFEKNCGEISLSFAKSHCGKGYGKEVINRLIQFGFDEMGLDYLEGYTYQRNRASDRLCQGAAEFQSEVKYEHKVKGKQSVRANYYKLTREDYLTKLFG